MEDTLHWQDPFLHHIWLSFFLFLFTLFVLFLSLSFLSLKITLCHSAGCWGHIALTRSISFLFLQYAWKKVFYLVESIEDTLKTSFVLFSSTLFTFLTAFFYPVAWLLNLGNRSRAPLTHVKFVCFVYPCHPIEPNFCKPYFCQVHFSNPIRCVFCLVCLCYSPQP